MLTPRHHFSFQNRNLIWRGLLLILFAASLAIQPVEPATRAGNASLSPAELAALQLEQLTPEERVGQLFLLTFNGTDTSMATPIHEFIANYHIGGVILERDNDNFSSSEQIPEDCWKLIQDLQIIEHSSSVQGEDSAEEKVYSAYSQYIPLFVGISQEGNLSSYTEILEGLSPIPSQMSLGATWDPSLAQQVGTQVGDELSKLGINLLLGPNMDVMSDPSPGLSDLGVRSFGGDPYWVAKFGQSYIKGVHLGSQDNIAVVAKYFPGLGGSDRLPEEEVATVRKSLEQLKQIDLAPFFAITGNAPDLDSSADALLNSHIRYQGLQGNIRSTTRPISLDPQAFDLLMSLTPLGTWRDSGGIIVSDNLGSQALQNLFDPSGQSYNINRVAVDAFIAGNDILYLGNYGDVNKPIPNHEIIDTIELFAQKYIEDQDFANRVDNSVLRILTLKNEIYFSFNLSNVLTPENGLSSIGNGKVDELVARQSATLVNPDISDLGSILQPPPTTGDRLVILTDTDATTLCSSCPPEPTLAIDSLENAIIRLYGPLSGRQLTRANITSYSFRDLTTLLDYPSSSEQMVTDLHNTNWIVIASLDLDPDRPYSYALTRLLSERQDLIRDKKVIVFAFGAPYYLDATNISKVSAFFALYNRLPSSLDVAARILFNEFPTFHGSLPVSVPGINYDLITATSPDPEIEFPIYIGQIPDEHLQEESIDITPTPAVYEVEDQVDLFTGVILDHNGNPVPDGTPVTFIITSQGLSSSLPQVTTTAGSANTSFFIETSDVLSIHAVSSSARSQTLSISVRGDTDLSPTSEAPATPTLEVLTPTPAFTNEGDDPEQQMTRFVDASTIYLDWVISIIIILTISIIAYQAGSNYGLVVWGIRWFLSSLIAGLAAYIYLILDLPGRSLIFPGGLTRIGLFVIVGLISLTGWLLAYIYQRFLDP